MSRPLRSFGSGYFSPDATPFKDTSDIPFKDDPPRKYSKVKKGGNHALGSKNNNI